MTTLPISLAEHKITLRDYQVECLEAIRQHLDEGKKRLLCILPTGTGKTVVFSHFVSEREGHTLILAHRDELLAQAGTKLDHVGQLDHGTVKAERNQLNHKIILGSVDTLANERRINQLPRFSTIIVDEAHHARSNRWTTVLSRLGAFDDDGPVVLGFTATPNRTDKQGLGKIFPDIAYQCTLPEMVARGYLSNLRAVQVKMDISLSGMKSSSSADYSAKELGQVMHAAGVEKLIAHSAAKYGKGRRLLIFTPTVELAYNVMREIQELGITAGALDGNARVERRKEVLDAFSKGDLDVLVNCALFTEGYDLPQIDAVMIARPTKSQLLYTQMVGRGTRPLPGKSECLVIDLVDATKSHRLVTLADLVGVDKNQLSRNGLKSAMKTAMAGMPPAGSLLGIAGAKMKAVMVDMFGQRDFVWTESRSGAWSLSVPSMIVHIVTDDSDSLAEEPKYKILVDRNGNMEAMAKGLDLSWAQGIAEDLVRSSGNTQVAKKSASWRKVPPTDAQRALLKRLSVPITAKMTKGEASDIISARMAAKSLARLEPEKATPKQLWLLRHEHIDVPDGITKEEASKIIAGLMAKRRSLSG
jgi:superfamily II DNA or RNA helicase